MSSSVGNWVTRDRTRNSHWIAALALLVTSGMLSACGNGQKQGANQAQGGGLPVSFVEAQRKDVPLLGEWVGTLDGYVNAQIQPQVTGYLIKQTYREGSPVAKDEVLFEIDPRPFQAVLDQAEGQVAQAKGALAQAQAQQILAEINLKRDTPLAEQRAIAQSQLDNDKQAAAAAAAQVESSRAQIATAEAAVETAKLNLGFTHVRALISGVAGQAQTQVGNLVSPQSVLTAVSQLDPIKVFFSISDREYLILIEQAKAGGGDLLKGSAKLPLTLSLANGQKFPHEGKIVFVDRQMDQQTGAIRIAAAFPNPGNILRPGQFGRVSAATQMKKNAVIVPQAAVTELQGLQQVYTVSPDNKVHVVNVQLGPQVGSDIIIDKGVDAGTKIITDNLQKLKEDMPVQPHPAEQKANAAQGAKGGASSGTGD